MRPHLFHSTIVSLKLEIYGVPFHFYQNRVKASYMMIKLTYIHTHLHTFSMNTNLPIVVPKDDENNGPTLAAREREKQQSLGHRPSTQLIKLTLKHKLFMTVSCHLVTKEGRVKNISNLQYEAQQRRQYSILYYIRSLRIVSE